MKNTIKDIKLIILVIIPLLLSCASTLIEGGANVRTVTDGQRECCCEFITLITTSCSMGFTSAVKTDVALRKAQNKIYEKGGNAMRIISINNDGESCTIVVEALKCNFENMTTAKY